MDVRKHLKASGSLIRCPLYKFPEDNNYAKFRENVRVQATYLRYSDQLLFIYLTIKRLQ